MALEAEGVAILSQGEFSRLARGLEPGAVNSTLTSWWAGERISPYRLWAMFDVGLRLIADDDATEVIEMALDRLEQALPEIDVPKRPGRS